jgi:hypothetical protein
MRSITTELVSGLASGQDHLDQIHADNIIKRNKVRIIQYMNSFSSEGGAC